MRVPFLELSRITKAHEEAFLAAYRRVSERGHFVLGPEVEAFEKGFSKLSEQSWTVGVANGTDAIELALRALEIDSDHEVITTPLTAMPTLMAIRATGARIRLADVDRQSGLVTAAAIEAALSPRTKFLVPVHLYGQVCEMKPIMDLARIKNLQVVEDCAQAHGARYDGKAAGSWGALAAWSFYPTKNIGALGDAGAVTGHDVALHAKIVSLRNYGQRKTYDHAEYGRNSRLDELQAAFLSCRLESFTKELKKRREIGTRYRESFGGKVVILSGAQDRPGNECSYHLFAIVAPYEREKFREKLLEKGVQTLIHYPTPAHRQGAFADLGYRPGEFPNSEFLAENVLSLPLNPYMQESEIERVQQAVRESV